MIYQNLKNMTEEEKKAHKRKQKAKAQRKYYQNHKEYYKNYSKQWAKVLLETKDKKINRLNNAINEIEAIVYANISNIDARISIQEVLDKLKELKGDNND